VAMPSKSEYMYDADQETDQGGHTQPFGKRKSVEEAPDAPAGKHRLGRYTCRSLFIYFSF